MPLFIHNFLQSVKMIVLENIGFEILKFLSAEGTPVMAAHSLLNAALAVHMPTSGHIAVRNGVAADLALELGFQLVDGDFE